MKRIVGAFLIAFAGLAVAMAAGSGPIALDWHKGGHLYVLLTNGSVSVLDETTKRKLATIPSQFGMVPVEIYSARLKGREFVFVSGFWGRTGSVWQYTDAGQPYARFDTPEQAASFDLDAERHLLYVASPVTSFVYAIDIDKNGSSAKRVAYIREAEAVGPVIFDPGRNRVIVADTGRGILYDVDVKTGAYKQIASDLGRPISLGFDAAYQTLFVADSASGRVHVLRLENGAFKRGDAITTGLRNLSAVTFGPDDTLFVADGDGAYQLSLKTKKLSRFAY
jgi:DNA-binding beta-propeller fold protein YncE